MNETKLRFGDWVFDPESGDLERADTRIRLQEQPALLLRELIAQAGRVVTREHLIGLLWPKGVVDFDTGLNTAVRKLRVALGDVAETPRYIETLPRRGYRFIAQVGAERQPPLQPPLPAPPGGLADGGPTASAPAVPMASAQAVPMAVLPVSPRRARVGPIALVLVAVAVACGIAWLLRGMARQDATARAADRKSIAVLPFENLTGRPEDAYLAEGLHEEVLNALARIRDLKVISRASVASYRGVRPDMHEISSRLGVGTVLEGSVRRDGNVLRLTTQLIDARTDSHLLATNYDRDLDHLLSLQSEVARAVAEALTATLSAHERGELERVGTNNGDAYRDYLKAESLFMQSVPGDDSGVVEPARLLEEAVRLDPEFADAQALLSRVHTLAFVSTEQASDGEHAKLAFERALAIDPKLVDARLARGLYELYVVRDLDQAFSDLEPVARLRPNSPAALQAMGFVLRRRGRMAESIPYFQRASDLDPLNEAYSPDAFITLLALRRYPEALELTKIFRARFPTQQDGYLAWARISAFSTQSLGPLRDLLSNKILDDDTRRSVDAQIAQGEGRFRDAIASWEARPDADPVKRAENLAFLYRAAGDGAQAEQRFRILERDLAQKLQAANHDADEISKQLALVQSMLGEHAAAIATIEQAHQHWPESLDPVNGPSVSFYRSVVLARAGRTDEAYAEVNRLLRVPYAAPTILWDDPEPVWLLLKDDPHFDKLIRHPPRL